MLSNTRRDLQCEHYKALMNYEHLRQEVTR